MSSSFRIEEWHPKTANPQIEQARINLVAEWGDGSTIRWDSNQRGGKPISNGEHWVLAWLECKFALVAFRDDTICGILVAKDDEQTSTNLYISLLDAERCGLTLIEACKEIAEPDYLTLSLDAIIPAIVFYLKVGFTDKDEVYVRLAFRQLQEVSEQQLIASWRQVKRFKGNMAFILPGAKPAYNLRSANTRGEAHSIEEPDLLLAGPPQ